jgi:hypothetical protein
MTRDELLTAQETIMDVVCGLCHWPYVYRDEETMYAEKCDFCPAAATTLTEIEKAASPHPTADNQIIPPKEG